MSLSERVRNARLPEAEGAAKNATVVQLRACVQRILPTDVLAVLAAENPQRARNELRRACDEVFRQREWETLPLAARERLVGQLMDSVFGFGPLEGMLADPEVTEIMVNGPNSIFFERGGRLYPSAQRFDGEEQLRALIDRILGPLGRRVDEAQPAANARLPQGHRVHVIIPPLSLVGSVMTIRKFSTKVMTLEDMVEKGSFDGSLRRFFTWLVRMRKNVAVSGGTGSGKTTLLNALSCEIPHNERIVTIEDSAELRFLEHPHVVRLEARPASAEGTGQVTIRDLVINALRMRPDRIVVGECRGAEALDMLQAMNTGHDGSLTTLHANAPAEVITRLTTMVRYAVDLPVDVVEANIASAVDVVVQVARNREGQRYVSDVVELAYDRSASRCVCHPVFRRGPLDAFGAWMRVPSWVGELPLWGVASSGEVETWKRALRFAA